MRYTRFRAFLEFLCPSRISFIVRFFENSLFHSKRWYFSGKTHSTTLCALWVSSWPLLALSGSLGASVAFSASRFPRCKRISRPNQLQGTFLTCIIFIWCKVYISWCWWIFVLSFAEFLEGKQEKESLLAADFRALKIVRSFLYSFTIAIILIATCRNRSFSTP